MTSVHRALLTAGAALVVALAGMAGCDRSAARADAELVDGEAAPDGTLRDAAAPDAQLPDARSSDAGVRDMQAHDAGIADAEPPTGPPRPPASGRWPVHPEAAGFPEFTLGFEQISERGGVALIGEVYLDIPGAPRVRVATDVPVDHDGRLLVEVEDLVTPLGPARARLTGQLLEPRFLCGDVSLEIAGSDPQQTRFGARQADSPFMPLTSCDALVCGGEPWAERICTISCGECARGFFCDGARTHATESLPPVCWPGDGCPDQVDACPEASSCGVVDQATICQPAGRASAGDACVVEPHGEGVPCAAGLVCLDGRCHVPCGGDAPPCADRVQCAWLQSRSLDFGACVPECDAARGTGCGEGEVCALEPLHEGQFGVCRPGFEGDPVGTLCDVAAPTCAPGLVCDLHRGLTDARCFATCELGDPGVPAICTHDEQCDGATEHPSHRWGLCRSACDPMGPNICPVGEACGTIDSVILEGGLWAFDGTCVPVEALLPDGAGCAGQFGSYFQICGPGLVCDWTRHDGGIGVPLNGYCRPVCRVGDDPLPCAAPGECVVSEGQSNGVCL